MPQNQLTPERMSDVVQEAFNQGILDHDDNLAAVFLDREMYFGQLLRVQRTFQDYLEKEKFKPHLAVKATGPIPALLKQAIKRGYGLEVASSNELLLGIEARCDPRNIQYDGPNKTKKWLRYALEEKVHINADNLAEVQRIADIVEELNIADSRRDYPSVGIRVNPEVGVSEIDYTSTAGVNSQFGVRISEHRAEILRLLEKYPWIDTLHFHVGSQLGDPTLIIKGAEKIVELALEARKNGITTLTTINIGGGFPVQYLREKPLEMEFEELIWLLFTTVPDLKLFKVAIEPGRIIQTNSGFGASVIEYTDSYPGFDSATMHFGAGILVREAYRPLDWKHNAFVCDNEGVLKSGRNVGRNRLEGPHCFSGDVYFPTNLMAKMEEGDVVIYADVGAYTTGMASLYGSENIPPIYQVDEDNNFRLVKKRLGYQMYREIYSDPQSER